MSGGIDLCAGSGGWSKAARDLELSILGLEIDQDACHTRELANLPTLQCDVTSIRMSQFAWARGLIGSPPCPSFSRGGKVRGKDDELCLEAIRRLATCSSAGLEDLRERCESTASMIVVEPLRWALSLNPEWIALEQVPPVLHLWEQMAEVLRDEGYDVWTGVLNAADYGVPQVRKRAILMARPRGHELGVVTPPAPTHAVGAGGGLHPWTTMFEAVGWGFTDSPAPTLPATSSGGPRVLDGGSGARAKLRRAYDEGRFIAPPTGVSRTGAVRVSEADAGVLQGFPADWPWQGRTQSIRHRQIGNAVPPPLAEAILKQLVCPSS